MSTNQLPPRPVTGKELMRRRNEWENGIPVKVVAGEYEGKTGIVSDAPDYDLTVLLIFTENNALTDEGVFISIRRLVFVD